jgi:hypothetical protein
MPPRPADLRRPPWNWLIAIVVFLVVFAPRIKRCNECFHNEAKPRATVSAHNITVTTTQDMPPPPLQTVTVVRPVPATHTLPYFIRRYKTLFRTSPVIFQEEWRLGKLSPRKRPITIGEKDNTPIFPRQIPPWGWADNVVDAVRYVSRELVQSVVPALMAGDAWWEEALWGDQLEVLRVGEDQRKMMEVLEGRLDELDELGFQMQDMVLGFRAYIFLKSTGVEAHITAAELKKLAVDVDVGEREAKKTLDGPGEGQLSWWARLVDSWRDENKTATKKTEANSTLATQEQNNAIGELLLRFLEFRGPEYEPWIDICNRTWTWSVGWNCWLYNHNDFRVCRGRERDIDGCRVRAAVRDKLNPVLDRAIAVVRDVIVPISRSVLATWETTIKTHVGRPEDLPRFGEGEEEEASSSKANLFSKKYWRQVRNAVRTAFASKSQAELSRLWTTVWANGKNTTVWLEALAWYMEELRGASDELLEGLNDIEYERARIASDFRKLMANGWVLCETRNHEFEKRNYGLRVPAEGPYPEGSYVECVHYYFMADPAEMARDIVGALAAMELHGAITWYDV